VLLLCGVLAACGGPAAPAPVALPKPPYAGGPTPTITSKPLTAPTTSPGAIKVAILLPLSGPNADLGKAMLEAAQLALFTTGSDRMTLVPRDTQGTASGAADAAKSAIADGAKLILGPLISDEVDAVKPIAQSANVNVIAFSTKTEVAGGNVFLIGFLPRQEVAREVSFAHDRGLNRFAALAPNTAYGHLMADALKQVVGESGATLTRVEFYTGDPSGTVKRIAAAGATAASGPAPAGPGFDALLLPEGGDQLRQIAQQLKAAGIDTSQVRLLGSGLWDDASISGEPALTGGWFAASPPDLRQDFVHRYQGAYGQPPPRLASLAFDAAALAAVLAKSPDPDPFSQQAIENTSGFTGVDGLFRFTPQGLVQRGLAVIEVQPGGDQVVSPAPRDFKDFAY
jgi:branched-chain amino acid transport system substrate-binding protein